MLKKDKKKVKISKMQTTAFTKVKKSKVQTK